jgi:HAD superfamily hydrolase (TIGR01484 family)
MRYLALATDYDGTIANQGRVPETVIKSLKELQVSGRKLILITGRLIPNLIEFFPEHEIFDLIVGENGAIVYDPKTKKQICICEGASQVLIDELQARRVDPISVGNAIVATWEPHDTTILESIRDLGLEMQIIFNKGAVMILPSGINKGAGLKTALEMLKISTHNTVGMGDAENDHAFLEACEFSVAVQNALPALKDRADITTKNDHGEGVIELVQQLIEDDLAKLSPKRHFIKIGETEKDKEPIEIDPFGTGILICGISGGGKSKTTLGILEKLSQSGHQFCLIDPEGDYESFDKTVVIGDSSRPPTVEEVMQLLADPQRSVITNLLGLPLEGRPEFFTQLLPRLQELRTSHGRPHWIVVDEAHHLFPFEWKKMSRLAPENLRSILMITVHPDRIAPEAMTSIDILIAIGEDIDKTVKSFAKQAELKTPALPTETKLKKGKGLLWFARTKRKPEIVNLYRAELEKIRHRRKYAEGELPEHCSFYFRGPMNKLNLRAQNLMQFNLIASGVDDDTWTYHLQKHDYSRWFHNFIKDDDLCKHAQMIESNKNISPKESRALIKTAIEERYTLPS